MGKIHVDTHTCEKPTYFYAIDKNTFNIDKQLQTESASLPMINFECSKID